MSAHRQHFHAANRLREPGPLPTMTDDPVREFWKGMWHGWALGAITTAALAVIFWKA